METKVENTVWGIADKKRNEKFVASIPKVEKTDFEDWQNRVDNDAKTEYSPMITVYTVTVQEHIHRTEIHGNTVVGISTPTEVKKSYLVAAKDSDKAYKAVLEYLKKEYPGRTWSYGVEASKLILDGTK